MNIILKTLLITIIASLMTIVIVKISQIGDEADQQRSERKQQTFEMVGDTVTYSLDHGIHVVEFTPHGAPNMLCVAHFRAVDCFPK